MKKFLAGVLCFSAFFMGCEAIPQGSPSGSVSSARAPSQEVQKIKIVTSFYPLYEIARTVGGEYVDVQNLVPPGAEPHDYELTPKDISRVFGSSILFVNGGGLEPWFGKISSEAQQQGVRIIDASKLVDEPLPGDPHFWLDPLYYMKEVDNFEKTLSGVDPSRRDYYSANARKFAAEILALSGDFESGLQNCSFREFVTNHAAFGYLARRYDIEMIPITGLSPDAEPSPKNLAALTDLLKSKNIRYVLVETLVSPKIAETLAREVGAQTSVLNPLEGLADEDIARGQSYVSVMRENLNNLQIAMDCR